MRRFLTLVLLLSVSIPAGLSVSACYRNPAANYCNGQGYGLKVGQVAYITLQPELTGISLAFGQTTQIQAPQAFDCKNASASVGANGFHYGTTNNQIVDISPTGLICAGTWNRNSGGGIADYTTCNLPNPLPKTNELLYSVAYITATASSVVSNPVTVHIHAPVTSVSLDVPPPPGFSLPAPGSTAPANQCYSQGETAQLDAEGCNFTTFNGKSGQYELCAPPTINSSNSACTMPPITPDIIVAGTLISITSNGGVVSGTYSSGGTISGTTGQTCTLTSFNNGAMGTNATVALTGSNTIASGTPLTFTAAGTGATAAPTTAVLSNGTATCSGTATVATSLFPIIGNAGQTCLLTNFNNGSTGATASVTLTANNTFAPGTPLVITAGGSGATAPPTTAQFSSGTAVCSGIANIRTTMTPVPTCQSSIGTLSFNVGTASVASINPTNNQITAQQPGTTVITSSIAGSGSSAGYFSTCPPASITVTLANGATSGTVTKGVAQNLTTTVLDTNNKPITGLALSYQSTNPVAISAGAGGTITTAFPGVASINAICQPGACNPAPINQFGFNGTGLSLSSNPVTITTPGTATNLAWFGAPGTSQYFVSADLLTGTLSSTVRLPFVPNSMMMDRIGANIFFGSPRELMVYSTATNTLSTQSAAVPGVVLAVSPDGSKALINDQARHIFYLYTTSGGGAQSFPGMGNAAQWTPDGQTLYITDNAELNTPASCSTPLISGHTDALFVYNLNTGWNTFTLPSSHLPPDAIPSCTTQPNTAPPTVAQTPAILIPSVGAYLRGDPTVAHTWCPSGTVGNQATITYYPVGDPTALVQSDVLASTVEGRHVLGAQWNSGGSITLHDIAVTIPTTTTTSATGASVSTPDACAVSVDSNGVQTMDALILSSSTTSTPLAAVSASSVNQVVTGSTPVPVSGTAGTSLAFITYNGTATGASLPFYLPASGGAAGTPGSVPLTGASSITGPIAGAFSPDNTLFFVSTAGDNMIHFISIPVSISSSSQPADSQQVSPKLPGCDPSIDSGCTFTGTPGDIVPATAIGVKPRSTT